MSSSTRRPPQPMAEASTNGNGNADTTHKHLHDIPSNLSTTALQHKLKQLREEAAEHSQLLTQKLATSQSGQDLLHMGSSLSSLPPDLHNLITQLHPFLAAVEQCHEEQLEALQHFVQDATEIRQLEQKHVHAQHCADAYQDLVAAEAAVQRDVCWRRRYAKASVVERGTSAMSLLEEEHEEKEVDEVMVEGDDETCHDELDHSSSLERAAHIALCLVQDLQAATQAVSAMTMSGSNSSSNKNATTSSNNDNHKTETNASLRLRTPLPVDTERARFLMKLAPRIRKLESDTAVCLCQRLELVLKEFPQQQLAAPDEQQQSSLSSSSSKQQQDDALLLMLGHCMRGLALLGRGHDVESIFARVAIMPLIRSLISMGRLDQGGSRGECAGLQSLLDEMLDKIATTFGPALCYAECMFDTTTATTIATTTTQQRDIDLLTDGVWVPIATALMADAGIKMAIFSPGIASILQTNYLVLDAFLAQLASRLLKQQQQQPQQQPTSPQQLILENSESNPKIDLYYRPILSNDRIQQAQERVYKHSKTAEFNKKWNLPIYYQLRFGESCKRLNGAIDTTRRDGWAAEDVFDGTPQEAEELKEKFGFELALFLELYHLLLGLWRPDVILKPLTNRFLRGSVQLVGRVVTFIEEGMDGTIKFGQEPPTAPAAEIGTATDSVAPSPAIEKPLYAARSPYCWGETEADVGAVAWELTILESALRHDYVELICQALNADIETPELQELVREVLEEACNQIHPLIDKAWNEYIVEILTKKCSAPLAAVKGVAATYRMTNRPPPTQASHFVETILRPLKEFSKEFANRTPEHVGLRWKQQIVVTISDKYAAAVEELLSTVARTEVALQRQNTRNRRAARISAAVGMSDGEKVKLQLYLDHLTFVSSVEEAGVNPQTVRGIAKLEKLTKEGESLHRGKGQENGN